VKGLLSCPFTFKSEVFLYHLLNSSSEVHFISFPSTEMPDENSTSGKKRRLSSAEIDEVELEHKCQRALEFINHYEENPSPSPTDEDRLREHIGIGEERSPNIKVLFFIEVAPPSSRRGAACQFGTCNKRIAEGYYRIAVQPGMNNYYGSLAMSPEV
jgi:hypothetical protein